MNKVTQKKQIRNRRHARVRAKVVGTSEKPRLSVYRSNKFTYAQLIDDTAGVTLVGASDMKDTAGTKIERAQKIGKTIAEEAKKQGIEKAAFDRGGFKYWGRVQAVAEGAREAGLQF